MQKAANPNATDAAQRLLDHLSDTAGKGIITGQHTQTVPMEEIAYIKEVTGKEPVLWRPFHEAYGKWFWWGAKGPAVASELYKRTDYREQYEEVAAATSKDKVAALAEIGYLPDIDILAQTKIPWAYYMTWSKEFCIGEMYNSRTELKKMYSSPYAVTL